MTITNSGTKLNSLKDAPEAATNSIADNIVVLMRMTKSFAGFNEGEVARFKSKVAADYIRRGIAVLEGSTVLTEANAVGTALHRALGDVRRAFDARRAAMTHEKILANAELAAEESIAAVYAEHGAEIERAFGARAVLEAVHAAATEAEDNAIAEALVKVSDFAKEVESTTKTVKKSDDKEAAEAAVVQAQENKDAAQAELDVFIDASTEASKNRAAEIKGVADFDPAIKDAADAKIAELEAELENHSQMISKLEQEYASS